MSIRWKLLACLWLAAGNALAQDALPYQTPPAEILQLAGEEARRAQTGNLDAFGTERVALEAFLRFAREHKEIYRIIDEAEFVDPASYRQHYETIAARIADRLRAGAAAGDFRDGMGELEAWALMGMNVFVGLRYVVWGGAEMGPEEVAAGVNRLLAEGVMKR